MGTNYYWHEKPPCACCGRPFEPKHIGKSSAGWCFALHIIPDEGITDLTDWEKLWEIAGSEIIDEYGRKLSAAKMKAIITVRTWPHMESEFDYQANYAEPGPNGLARHQLTYGCLKHGAGTWDCIEGEFS